MLADVFFFMSGFIALGEKVLLGPGLVRSNLSKFSISIDFFSQSVCSCYFLP